MSEKKEMRPDEMVNGRAHFEEETRRASVSEEPNGQRGCCSLANEVDATLILAQSDSVSIFYVETLSLFPGLHD